ncbi:hypothetical protein G7090_14000 [Leclercia sp. 29361]|uniref:hypothetical protein n=1 Tax=Leclercia sp. 29361 TaxID=2714951 RepID=UPI00140DD3B8|nr:hypothetical protein [Leclercia sp. 29361]QIK14422.1 hypothetical protein G7090_14000 [Leclercia sp. 29361]
MSESSKIDECQSAHWSVKVQKDPSERTAGSNKTITVNSTKIVLSEEMREAVVDAVNDALQKATKPGGLLWNNRGGR